jgi:hypothetical protein
MIVVKLRVIYHSDALFPRFHQHSLDLSFSLGSASMTVLGVNCCDAHDGFIDPDF